MSNTRKFNLFFLLIFLSVPVFAQSEVRPQCSGGGDGVQRHNCFVPSVDPYSECPAGTVGVFERYCNDNQTTFYVRCHQQQYCSCPAGYVLSGHMCVVDEPEPDCQAGPAGTHSWPASGNLSCIGSCQVIQTG